MKRGIFSIELPLGLIPHLYAEGSSHHTSSYNFRFFQEDKIRRELK